MTVIKPQRLLKTLLQALEKIQRSAQEQHITLDFTSLRKTGQRLVYHRLENGGRNIFTACAVIHQGLDIAFREYTAPGSNGINFRRFQTQQVKICR